MVPFAAYDAGRWEKTWPEADEAAERAPAIDAIQSIWAQTRRARTKSVDRVASSR